mmetsp:Transcript_27966/g.64474  ORF Transcript_27966/g.64474 Transcript_27966/m.64474 type:complete len:86 (+) Transcript_27966:1455-1712(+)
MLPECLQPKVWNSRAFLFITIFRTADNGRTLFEESSGSLLKLKCDGLQLLRVLFFQNPLLFMDWSEQRTSSVQLLVFAQVLSVGH